MTHDCPPTGTHGLELPTEPSFSPSPSGLHASLLPGQDPGQAGSPMCVNICSVPSTQPGAGVEVIVRDIV